ncbi:MAG: hypothetical protein GXP62_19580 [Oligoflexia bacterium]|nr:hypothetical protein [Oligoflexia bacterium]
MLLALLLSCGTGAPSTPDPVAPPPLTDPAIGAATGKKAPLPLLATVAPEPGWGAVMWQDGVWYRTGGGVLAASSRAAVTLKPTGSTGVCGDVVADPKGAMIVLPTGASPPALTPAPAIQAALVERAAWRLDELLPDLDRFSPAPSSPDPSRARGVEVGSVAKVRRHGAPPILVATGHRDCTGVIAVLSADASSALAYGTLDHACEPLRVLPPNDLDGDKARELVAWSRSRVALYRLVETPGSVSLVRLADWSCP